MAVDTRGLGLRYIGMVRNRVACAVLVALTGCGSSSASRSSAPASPVPSSTRLGEASAVMSPTISGAPWPSGPTRAPGSVIPAAGSKWQFQLQGLVDTSVDAHVFEIDGFATPASTVTTLHSLGRHVICYIDGGSWENFRPDAGRFPTALLGNVYSGYPNERWLDIRDQAALPAILAARLHDQCVAKGFDAVEWDNVEGFNNDTGFPLTADDQLRFNTTLADVTHAAGLRVALKNDRGQAAALAPVFDEAVDEECQQFAECGLLQSFVDRGKPVFDVEYDPAAFSCPGPTGLSIILKDKDLLAKPRRSC